MSRPSRAAVIEDAINRRQILRLRSRGWVPVVVPYPGYGSADFVRVLGRVLLKDPDALRQESQGGGVPLEAQRGWRSFITTHVGKMSVRITAGAATVHTTTDRSGYVDVVLRGHQLEPGWQTVTITPISGAPVSTRVNVVPDGMRFGLISDIDDTVMVTYLPRPLIAFWNTFVRHTATRQPVPGMPGLYAALLRRHPGMPVIYLSTGSWNAAPTLRFLLRRYHYPEGPLLLTDWGPTNTGWFRSGQEHKRTALRRLAIEYPDIQWLLVGDDGQHDPVIYREMAREHPEHVGAILIRELNPMEQVLAHGTTTERNRTDQPSRDDLDRPVPYLAGPDGFALEDQLPREAAEGRLKARTRR